MGKQLFEIRHCVCGNGDVSAREQSMVRSQTSATFNGTNLLVGRNLRNIKWLIEQIKAFGELLWKMSAFWQMKIYLSCIILLHPAGSKQQNKGSSGIVSGTEDKWSIDFRTSTCHERDIQYFYGARSSLAVIWYCSIEVKLIYVRCSSGWVYLLQGGINKSHVQSAW